MTRNLVQIAFPTWRDLWESLDRVPELLTAADATLRRRATGNHRVPRWSGRAQDIERLSNALHGAKAWLDGEPPRDKAARPKVIRGVYAVLSPALGAVGWPRWLHLERAFLDASGTGDLLFAALVLRTMSEEVVRLHALDTDADQLATLTESTAESDQVRLKQFLSCAWTSLAPLPADTILEGSNWPSLNPTAKTMPQLENARAALNSYVHPNYGGHIAALFPERASAARLLLQAVVAVYEAFFALSWSEKAVSGSTLPLGIGPFESWTRTTRRLFSHTLPEVRRTAESDALTEVMKAPNIAKWLTTKRDDLSAALRDPAAVPLLEDLPRQPLGSPGARDVNIRIWEGARAADILAFAAVRRAEQQVVSEFPTGAPDTTDQVRWLRFNSLSLQLAMLIDQVKAAAFKVQLVRQVVQGNSLAALLCVRSLIEHRALAVWLPNQIGESLDSMAAQMQAAGMLPQSADLAETALAKFLAGQGKETKEERRAWIMTEHGEVRLAWLNLRNIVKAAFPEDDGFRRLYALSSAAMHTRSCRGVDLLLRASDMTTYARRVGLLVLERLSNWDEEMDHLSAAAIASVRLEHAAVFGGASAAPTDWIAQQVFGRFDEALIPGADYSGYGTKGFPFIIGSHLEYYRASHTLLAHLDVDIGEARRALDQDASGELCDRWNAVGREYWFKAPVYK